ncbi:MAG: GNAT family N-acetyltransferase [Akkermansiaceae bacterium]|nr:GNAT family N-acetyltransferase [Verrucomicrobiales bacterium]
MKHDLQLKGHAFGLRPVTLEDAGLVVELRTSTERSQFLNPISSSVEVQREWLQRYFDRPGDYYFVINRERDNFPEGLIGLYDLDSAGQRAEWGRWIVRPGSLAAVESAFLIYQAGFERLGLAEIYCRTLAANAAVVSFHDSCGLSRRGVIKEAFEINGSKHDAVEHFLTRDAWPSVKSGLESKASFIARRVNR